MRLSEWIEREGRGALTRLQVRSGLAYSTIHRVVNGASITKNTAQLISAATDGEVSVGELMTDEEERLPPTGTDR